MIAAAKCNNGCIHSILLIEGRILKERGHGRESKDTQIEDAKTTDGGCVVSNKEGFHAARGCRQRLVDPGDKLSDLPFCLCSRNLANVSQQRSASKISRKHRKLNQQTRNKVQNHQNDDGETLNHILSCSLILVSLARISATHFVTWRAAIFAPEAGTHT